MKIKKMNNKKYNIKEKIHMMNGWNYKTWKFNKQADFDKLPIYFAFSDEQFEEALQKMNLKDTPEDLKKIVNIGFGGMMRKCDLCLLENHNLTFSRENLLFWLKNSFRFAYGAFRYELNNHEFFITYDLTDTLNALDLTEKDIQKNNILFFALTKARHDYWKKCCEIN